MRQSIDEIDSYHRMIYVEFWSPTVEFNLHYSLNVSYILQRLKIEGFVVYDWFDQWQEGIDYMTNLIVEGKLKVKESVVKGFENLPEAFLGIFDGKHIGKAVVKA